jgi:hypothetical protein
LSGRCRGLTGKAGGRAGAQTILTTKIESKALELGRSVMKSIHIEDQGFFGIGSGRNNIYG